MLAAAPTLDLGTVVANAVSDSHAKSPGLVKRLALWIKDLRPTAAVRGSGSPIPKLPLSSAKTSAELLASADPDVAGVVRIGERRPISRTRLLCERVRSACSTATTLMGPRRAALHVWVHPFLSRGVQRFWYG